MRPLLPLTWNFRGVKISSLLLGHREIRGSVCKPWTHTNTEGEKEQKSYFLSAGKERLSCYNVESLSVCNFSLGKDQRLNKLYENKSSKQTFDWRQHGGGYQGPHGMILLKYQKYCFKSLIYAYSRGWSIVKIEKLFSLNSCNGFRHYFMQGLFKL